MKKCLTGCIAIIMNKKFYLFLLVFMLMGKENIFAQKGYVKPTFNLGYTLSSFAAEPANGLFTAGLDIDLVHKFGLTIGLQGALELNENVIFILPCFGAGYTYTSRAWGSYWSAGIKLTGCFVSHTGFLGIDVNGTYWFNNILGVTGTLASYFSMASGNIAYVGLYPIKAGISMRF